MYVMGREEVSECVSTWSWWFFTLPSFFFFFLGGETRDARLRCCYRDGEIDGWIDRWVL